MILRNYKKILLLLLLVAILPMLCLNFFTIYKIRKEISREVENGLINRATEIAARVSSLLNRAASDLETLKFLPRNEKTYLQFFNSKKSLIWTRIGNNTNPEESKTEAPLYRQITFIDKSGKEQVKIENNKISLPSELNDVSNPKNTLFKSEEFFLKAKTLSKDEIYVGHLSGWYVSAQEQLKDAKTPEDAFEGRHYDGLIRLAAPVYNEQGIFDGVVTLGLDHSHLQEITIHIDPLQNTSFVFAPYSSGNYVYLFDDEGWIITHQKLWDIRGLDASGREVGPFQRVEGTNIGPVNLIRGPKNEAHFKLLELMNDVLNKKSGVFILPNLGLNVLAPTLQAQAYAPIFFEKGGYQKNGVFGGVMATAKVASVNNIVKNILKNFYLFSIITLVVVMGLSFLLASKIGELQKSHSSELKLKQDQIELEKKLSEMEKKEKALLKNKLDRLEQELSSASFEGMVYASEAMKKVLEQVLQVAQTDATVLILGERGVGKEKIATAIHNLSPRKLKTILSVNCAAISENLIESELFGHAKGAFTGALKERPGFFEAASTGTLFLDEIGEISLGTQVKFLRVLQEKKVIRVGETKERNIDTRLIVATNKDLSVLVKEGRFRADLYDRLNIIPISIPPLKDRKEDILPLVQHFLQEASLRYNKNILGFTQEVIEMMRDYDWPGNIRELQNAIERAVIQTKDNYIEKGFLTLGPKDSEFSEGFALPDMTIDELKVKYAQYIRNKYPTKPLKEIREILGVDWNTLRKYLGKIIR